MKFGKYLLEQQRPGWEAQYLDYKGLKDEIKAAAEDARKVGAAFAHRAGWQKRLEGTAWWGSWGGWRSAGLLAGSSTHRCAPEPTRCHSLPRPAFRCAVGRPGAVLLAPHHLADGAAPRGAARLGCAVQPQGRSVAGPPGAQRAWRDLVPEQRDPGGTEGTWRL